MPPIRWIIPSAELGVFFVAWRLIRPTPRRAAAALLASAWTLPASVLMGLVATRFELWKVVPPLELGTPPDLLLSRTIMWGVIPALCFPSVRLRYLYFLALGLDLAQLAFIAGPGSFSNGHLAGEALAAAFCFIPAQLFSRWTWKDEHLTARAWMHLLFHAGLLLGVLPGFILSLGGGDWSAPFARPSLLNKLYLQLLLLPAVVLITAMQEFMQRGRGTPMPDDPPRRLVTSGVYAYVANPMQIGKLAVVAGWGLFWGNAWVVALAAIGALYSLCIASPREDRALGERFPRAWDRYRHHVRRWWPRWRPFHFSADTPCDAGIQPARLYLDLACTPCTQLAEWLRRWKPEGLAVLPMEHHPLRISTRMIYEAADGVKQEFGVAALGRALEHINLFWAFCSWMLRLPGIAPLAQLIADAFDPRTAANCELAVRPSGSGQ